MNNKMMLIVQGTVLWGDLDRWNHTNTTYPEVGIPPPYSLFTGFSLQWAFILFFILTGAQILVTLLIKVYTSRKFSTRGDYMNKFIHLLLGLNIASPFEDWDQGRFSLKEYRERHRQTNIEMALSISVNIMFSMIMLCPLYYTGKRECKQSQFYVKRVL